MGDDLDEIKTFDIEFKHLQRIRNLDNPFHLLFETLDDTSDSTQLEKRIKDFAYELDTNPEETLEKLEREFLEKRMKQSEKTFSDLEHKG